MSNIIEITISTSVNAQINKVWKYWTEPKHIVNWNFAQDTWHCPNATNNLKVGGKFLYRMEAKDGSFGFDFGGEYTKIDSKELIEYVLGDGRKVKVKFEDDMGNVNIEEIFEAEEIHGVEAQKFGWQSILDNFKNYVEQN